MRLPRTGNRSLSTAAKAAAPLGSTTSFMRSKSKPHRLDQLLVADGRDAR